MGWKGYTVLNRLSLGLRSWWEGVGASQMGRRRWDRNFHATAFRQSKSGATLYAQITRFFDYEINVKSKLKRWEKERGRDVPVGELKTIISKLTEVGFSARTLEVFEWMNEKGIYKFSPQDRALQLKLICRLRGCSAAECYFSSLPEQEKNEETYGTLLRCYVQQDQTEKALLHFQHMKELGFASSSHPYNEIMCHYANNGRLEKVPEVLDELKKSKVLPDNDSYRTCISSFGLRTDLDGMEKMLEEMESQPHIVMDWCTYVVVAKHYEKAGLAEKAIDALKKGEVRLGMKEEGEDTRTGTTGFNFLINSDYHNVIKALVKLGEIDEAEKVVMEWEASGNWRSVKDISIPRTLIEEFIKNMNLRKAENMVDYWTRKERRPGVDILWRLVCKGYIRQGAVGNAFHCFRGGVDSLRARSRSNHKTPCLTVVMQFLHYLEDENESLPPVCLSRTVGLGRAVLGIDQPSLGAQVNLHYRML